MVVAGNITYASICREQLQNLKKRIEILFKFKNIHRRAANGTLKNKIIEKIN